ncbi:MAG: ATP-dependent DNA helicase [Candidatus Bathyarchaeia archaeon]
MKTDLSYFPYRLRDHQSEFAEYVQNEVRRSKNIVVEAVTGFGKTPLILASLLPIALRDGQRIIWAVRTGTETDRPIEELKTICKAFKIKELFGLSFRGKKDMCLLLKEIKLKGELSHEDAYFICKSNKKTCEYLMNYELKEINLYDFIKSPRLYSEVLKFCEKAKVCPYKLQLDLIPFANVIALNYNYILDENISWLMRRKIDYRESFLVMDEAHNLQSAYSSINSNRITTGTIERAIKEIKSFDSSKLKNINEFLSSMLAYFKNTLKNVEEEDVEFKVKDCINNCSRSFSDFEKIVGSIRRYGVAIRRKKLSQGKAPRSSLFHLSDFWLSVIENLNEDGIAFIATKTKRKSMEDLILEMWDMRSSVVLKGVWKNFNRCIFCSGTLKPMDSFAEIVGLEGYSGKSFPSMFSKQNALSLITQDLTTRGETLNESMARAYLRAIESFIKGLNSNIAVFSASYRIQDALLKLGLKDTVEANDRKFFLEEQGISGNLSRRILEEFKSCAYGSKKGVLCASMGGRFAEGADFPGKELEGIFMVGIPFDRVTNRTRLYIEYYQKIYGKEKGKFYAYVFPAIRRASQSLGRALRSKDDRAIFILGDRRYRRFLKLLPDFVKKNYRILESNDVRFNREITEFSMNLLQNSLP